MIKVFAALDAVVALMILLELFSVHIHWRIVFAGAVYMFVKAWLYWPDFLSIVDGVIGLIALIGIFYINSVVGWAGFLWLGWKSIASFF